MRFSQSYNSPSWSSGALVGVGGSDLTGEGQLCAEAGVRHFCLMSAAAGAFGTLKDQGAMKGQWRGTPQMGTALKLPRDMRIPPLRIGILLEAKPSEIQNLSTER